MTPTISRVSCLGRQFDGRDDDMGADRAADAEVAARKRLVYDADGRRGARVVMRKRARSDHLTYARRNAS
jgi:hypothetical protein